MDVISISRAALEFSLFRKEEGARPPLAVIKWWELRRIPFNIIVGATGMVTSCSLVAIALVASAAFNEAFELPDPPIFVIFGVVAYGIAANACYTAGWITEIFVTKVWPDKGGSFGQISFFLGVLFSVLLTLSPVFLIGGILVFRFAFR